MLVLIAAIFMVEPPPATVNPLGGPSASAPAGAAKAASLVQHDFNGKVIRTDQPPELAAVMLLTDLSEEAKKKIEGIMTRRGMVLDEFTARNIDLLTKFGQAAASGDKADQLSLAREAFDKLAELRKAGTLESQIAGVLSAEQAKAFKAHLAAYYDAIVAERQADPAEGEMGSDGKRKPPARLGIVIDERLKALGREIERAFYRSLYSGELLYQLIDKAVTLRPEQAAKIRGWCAEFAEKGGQNPTEEQKRELFVRVLSVLDAQQAKKAVEYLRKQGK